MRSVASQGVDYSFPVFERMTSFGGFLRGEWELPTASLTSITGFERYSRDREIDADYSPNTFFEFKIRDDAWQFSQDLQVKGELEQTPLSWGSGGYFLMEELVYVQTTRASISRQVDQLYVQTTWSFGIYGDFSWQFMDDFTLDGGVRYNWERKSMDAEVFRAGLDKCVPSSLGLVIPECSKTVTFSAPTGTLGLTYDFNAEVSGYWKYSRGWKALTMRRHLSSIGPSPRSR